MPRTFSELVNLVALVRPVSKSEVEPYCYNREHGWEPIHPLLADILKGTNGILTFQEQAMQIAVALADFSVAEADELRRIIGKKIAEDCKNRMEVARGRQRLCLLQGTCYGIRDDNLLYGLA
jgi:DNA polymerase III alpha subunit